MRSAYVALVALSFAACSNPSSNQDSAVLGLGETDGETGSSGESSSGESSSGSDRCVDRASQYDLGCWDCAQAPGGECYHFYEDNDAQRAGYEACDAACLAAHADWGSYRECLCTVDPSGHCMRVNDPATCLGQFPQGELEAVTVIECVREACEIDWTQVDCADRPISCEECLSCRGGGAGTACQALVDDCMSDPECAGFYTCKEACPVDDWRTPDPRTHAPMGNEYLDCLCANDGAYCTFDLYELSVTNPDDAGTCVGDFPAWKAFSFAYAACISDTGCLARCGDPAPPIGNPPAPAWTRAMTN
jgi:hypothetical protein